MDSINKHRVSQRVSFVYDVAHGAQASSKDIKNYVKELRKAVGIENQAAGNAAAFLRDFGKGI